MTPIETKDLLRMRYAVGGRGPHVVDCLGVVLLVLQRLGIPLADPWPRFVSDWSAGCDPGSMLERDPGEGWKRTVPVHATRDGDMLITNELPLGVGVVYQGRVWTAMPDRHVVSLERRHVACVAAWRFEP